MKLKTLAAAATLALLAGCSSIDLSAPGAPTEDRSTISQDGRAPLDSAKTVPVPSDGASPHLRAETQAVASDRVHTVAAGDTIWNISQRYGCNPREVMQLNGISDPTQLAVGSQLVMPLSSSDGRPAQIAPAATMTDEGAVAATTTSGVELEAEEPEVVIAVRPKSPEEIAGAELAKEQAKRDAAARGELQVRWPVQGRVIANFAQTGNLGIDIAGSKGDPIMVVLDGTVQYVGKNAADGYGEFVIVRHNIRLPGRGSTPLVTVYGNTSKILVKVGESVRAGQKIAEMGSTGTNRTKLRFEIRQGTPMDPMLYLQEQ